MTLISVRDFRDEVFRRRLMLETLGQAIVKRAAVSEPAYSLTGTLYHKKGLAGDWIMLSVPNALVRGVFTAMNEPGIELPGHPGNQFDAHIGVMWPEEVDAIGGPDKITERGKSFRYRIGGLVSMPPPQNWPDISRVWVLRIYSPELQALRRSYGLSSLPRNGQVDFYTSVAVRRKAVLGRNVKRKS